MNRSIPDPFQLSGKGSRSDQDPKKAECDPDLELLRSVPDRVWVILGCFRTIGIGIGIVKGFLKYWYWVLARAFQSIGIGIGYC